MLCSVPNHKIGNQNGVIPNNLMTTIEGMWRVSQSEKWNGVGTNIGYDQEEELYCLDSKDYSSTKLCYLLFGHRKFRTAFFFHEHIKIKVYNTLISICSWNNSKIYRINEDMLKELKTEPILDDVLSIKKNQHADRMQTTPKNYQPAQLKSEWVNKWPSLPKDDYFAGKYKNN